MVIKWTDGTEEKIYCEEWDLRDRLIKIQVSSVRRDYRYVPVYNVKMFYTE